MVERSDTTGNDAPQGRILKGFQHRLVSPGVGVGFFVSVPKQGFHFLPGTWVTRLRVLCLGDGRTAGIPPGCLNFKNAWTGGVAALNHRLLAVIPPG